MSAIELELSGSTRVRTSREELELKGRPQRSLLAMLALRVGERVSADQLVEWTWGAELPDNPLGALHTRLSRLRSSLGDHRDVVVSTGDAYLLDLERGAIDLVRYEDAIGDHGGSVERIVEVDSWWRGTPFADAEPLDVLIGERQRLEMLWLDGRGDLVDLLMDSGRLEEAFAWSERTLKHEPFDERLIAAQLTLAAKLKMGKGFVTRYELWRERYREVFGGDPPAELDALADEIGGRTRAGAASIVPKPVSHDREFDRVAEIPLFGSQAKQLLASESGTTVALGGHGFGKTVIAAAWRRQRLDAGTLTFVASGADVDQLIAALDVDEEPRDSETAIIVDDLHLASDTALDAFVRFWQDHRSDFRFFVTSRPPSPGSEVQQVLAMLSMWSDSAVVMLKPADLATVIDLVGEHGDHQSGSSRQLRVARATLRITGGHPEALDFGVRGVLARFGASGKSPSESEFAPLIAGRFEDEFRGLEPHVQALLALVAVTQRRIPARELPQLLEELVAAGVIDHLESIDFGEALAAANQTGLVTIGSERVASVGSATRYVVGRFAPDLLEAASTVMMRRAEQREDLFDVAMQRLADGGVPPRDLGQILDVVKHLEAQGIREEVLELGDRLTQLGWLNEGTDPVLSAQTARIHVVLGLAAEQEGRLTETDEHLGAALELGVRHDLEDVVLCTGTGWGDRHNPYRSSPSGARHSLAVAWAARRGSEMAQLTLEVETLRRVRRRGLPVPVDRLESLEVSLPSADISVQAHGWSLVAEVLLSYPLSAVAARLDTAISNADRCVREAPSERLSYDDPALKIDIVKGAYSLRRRRLGMADEMIQRVTGVADYFNNRLAHWYALAQATTLEAMRGSDAGWHRAVMKMAGWGRTYQVYYAERVEWYASVAARHFGLSLPDVEVLDADTFSRIEKYHPVLGFAFMSIHGEPSHVDQFAAHWRELESLDVTMLTPPALVYAARAARLTGAAHLVEDIQAALLPFAGEFSTMPNGACPVGEVDAEIQALDTWMATRSTPHPEIDRDETLPG